MVGSKSHHLNHAPNILYRDKQVLVRDVLDFLLEHQYIRSSCFDDGVIHRTVSGTGMGLRHSGSVANSSFLHFAELRPQDGLVRSGFRRQWGILHYFRFVDNVLFLLADQSYVEPLRGLLRHLLIPYTGKVEEISDHSISFLDMTLCKRVSGNSASIKCLPRLKSTGPILSH
eukprot:11764322-Karenia_brevis.AAC.1